MRYSLTDQEWLAIQPRLPNKPRGMPRVDDRRVLKGIFWVLRSGAPWRDLPECYGPHTTCYNRFIRWRKAGVWDRIMAALTSAHDAGMQMIDTSVIQVHQQGACVANGTSQHIGRSRGAAALPPVTTSSLQTISPSSNSPASGYGSSFMSPRPS